MRLEALYQSMGITRAHTCPRCGRTFEAGKDWGYSLGAKRYCSWRCVRAAEQGGRQTVEESAMTKKDEARRLKSEGMNNRQIAEQLGVSGVTVGKWLVAEPAPENLGAPEKSAEAPGADIALQDRTIRETFGELPRGTGERAELFRLLHRILDVAEAAYKGS